VGAQEALIAWEELRVAMNFPIQEQQEFLSAALSARSFLLLVDYLVQRKVVGTVWDTSALISECVLLSQTHDIEY
jgi:hypothetical protein